MVIQTLPCAEKTDVSLLSTITLYEVVMAILEKKLDDEVIRQFRHKIMNGSGIINFE